jgi:hypothetical protein
MHLGANTLQDVDGPVPTVAGFQDHLRTLTGLRDLRRQHQRIVVDPHTTELLPGLGHPHDHRATPMQIDTHDLPPVVLCLHGGAFTVRFVSTPSIPPGVTRSEAPLLHAIRSKTVSSPAVCHSHRSCGARWVAGRRTRSSRPACSVSDAARATR